MAFSLDLAIQKGKKTYLPLMQQSVFQQMGCRVVNKLDEMKISSMEMTVLLHHHLANRAVTHADDVQTTLSRIEATASEVEGVDYGGLLAAGA